MAAERRVVLHDSVLVVAVALGAAALGLILVSSGGRDDAYITYAASQRLVDHGEILNYSGQRVEQSSSILHVVLLAAVHRVTGISIPWLGYLFGIAAGMGAVGAAALVASRLDARGRVTAAVYTALSAPLVYWSFGGLETTLDALLLGVAVWAALGTLRSEVVLPRRSQLATICLLALCVAVRPENAPILLASIGGTAAVWWFRTRGHPEDKPPWARLAALAGVVAGSAVALTAFRWWYFGRLVPQPADAKAIDPSISSALTGTDYLFGTLGLGLGALTLMAAYGAWCRLARGDLLVALPASVVVAGGGFVVLAGGDWMEMGRFVCPFIPLIAALAAAGTELTSHRKVVATLISLSLVGGVFLMARNESTGVPVWAAPTWSESRSGSGEGTWFEEHNRVHLRDLPAVPELAHIVSTLASGSDEPVRVASTQAGLVAYYALPTRPGAVDFIDLYALSSRHFEQCPELFAPGVGPTEADVGAWYRGTDVCGADPPDIIWDLGRPTAEQLARYTLVFSTDGQINGPWSLPGAAVSGRQFILVRNDVVPRLG